MHVCTDCIGGIQKARDGPNWTLERLLLISWLKSPSAVILEPQNIVSVSIVSPSICHEVMGPDAVI